MTHNRERLIRTVRALGPLGQRFVFTGGSVVELLITDVAGPPMRATEDVDVIVAATTTSDYHELYPALASRGFLPDPESSVICRFKKGTLLLDVMPSSPQILGFSNKWYEPALQYPMQTLLADDLNINVINAVYFLATKFVAFRHRGKSNYFGSPDFEDIIAVVDGRPAILHETQHSLDNVRAFLMNECRQLLADRRFLEGISANLAPDAASQGRQRLVMDRFRALATLV